MSLLTDNCRKSARESFLHFRGYNPNDLRFLASDMSPRCYYRLMQSKKVLMDAPFPEDTTTFIKIANYLRDCGLRTPKIIDSDTSAGFILLEDFGDNTYTKVLSNEPEQEKNLYYTAIETLKQLQQKVDTKPYFLKNYRVDVLIAEVTVFIDWYGPLVFSEGEYFAAKRAFLGAWEAVFSNIPPIRHSVVLRDYHVDNIMQVSGNSPVDQCGLLDFQDALWGPVVYDFISLVEDARRTVNPILKEELWQFFLKDVPVGEWELYKNTAAILGAGRHIKVIGVFTRYAMQKRNGKYLGNLTRLWQYLEGALSNENLHPVAEWFANYLPPTKRIEPAL